MIAYGAFTFAVTRWRYTHMEFSRKTHIRSELNSEKKWMPRKTRPRQRPWTHYSTLKPSRWFFRNFSTFSLNTPRKFIEYSSISTMNNWRRINTRPYSRDTMPLRSSPRVHCPCSILGKDSSSLVLSLPWCIWAPRVSHKVSYSFIGPLQCCRWMEL